uniref:Uncharacterized protein n=1 Tax=Melanopsichium pennsylvanicum 4 TaxID=1398559 RepID=A0A077R2U4_9BASI|nr:uncharacterized protein BN887_05636 [Melanopsichium pennsylvanicum 4]
MSARQQSLVTSASHVSDVKELTRAPDAPPRFMVALTSDSNRVTIPRSPVTGVFKILSDLSYTHRCPSHN